MNDIHVTKIHCTNFRIFENRQIEGLTPGLNVLIGDNETGKSTILLALDLVLRASVSRVQSIGLESLMNRDVVAAFLDKEDRNFADLPIMEVDLFLSDMQKHEYEGPHNALNEEAYGICLICRPRDDLQDAIKEIIAVEGSAFPFEYYSIEFKTFSGAPLTPYKRPLDHLTIDNTRISNEYASKAYVRDLYKAKTEDTEQSLHQIKYRQAKAEFAATHLDDLNKKLDPATAFALRSDSNANLQTDLTIKHDNIEIDNLGVGMQCFIRTSFALSKKANLDVVLLEEPENHLSHLNMKKLIEQISQETGSQVFIATHSSYICSRLDLRKAILFGAASEKPLSLNDIPSETAEFFMKAPQNSLLEFIQSPRNILVEGDAEYMLLAPFYRNATNENVEDGTVSIISVGGLSFPRYLDVAKKLKNRVAVITDNDGDPASARLQRYREYASADHISIFCDSDAARNTFEVCVYQDNRDYCEAALSAERKKLSVQEYMLKNKSDAAFKLASVEPEKLVPPDYVKDAISWARN